MKKLKKGILFGLICLAIIWAMMMISVIFQLHWGIVPRELSMRSLVGILLCPVMHEGFGHILANSIPLFVLTATLMVNYPKLTIKVMFLSIVMGGSLVWILGRGNAVHMGASGLIFAMIGFLIFNVAFRKDWKSFAIAVGIGFIYGSSLLGIFPSNPHVSWEGHLFGLLSGIYLAFLFRKSPSGGIMKKCTGVESKRIGLLFFCLSRKIGKTITIQV